jgi:Protein of unknown function (DUF3106)
MVRPVARAAVPLLGSLLLTGYAFAWQGRAAADRAADRPEDRDAAPAQGRRQPAGRQGLNPNDHQPGFLEHLRELPPEEQEKVLKNNARFRQLPPQLQQRIRENLSRWNSLTPEQRDMMRQREKIVQSLPVEQRDQLRQIFPRYRQLPADRRQAVMNAFLQMRDMPAAEREKFLASADTQQRFSPEERDILTNLNGLLPR